MSDIRKVDRPESEAFEGDWAAFIEEMFPSDEVMKAQWEARDE